MAFVENNVEIVGKAYWAKILGTPGPAYNPGEREWSIDVSLDDEALKTVTSVGLAPKVKTDQIGGRGKFLSFKRAEFKKGTNPPTANRPISVVDAKGQPWDQAKLIGNESIVKVRFNVYETPLFGRKGTTRKPAILEVQLLAYVEYERKENAPPSRPSGNGASADESWDVAS